MFQFPAFALCGGSLGRPVARFGDPRVECLRTANRGLSQLIASFVASRCQGIHHLLFVACSPHLHPIVARRCSAGSQVPAVRLAAWHLPGGPLPSRRADASFGVRNCCRPQRMPFSGHPCRTEAVAASRLLSASVAGFQRTGLLLERTACLARVLAGRAALRVLRP